MPQQPSPQTMSNAKLTPQQMVNLQQQHQMHNQRNPSQQPASQQIRKPSDLYLNQQQQQMNKATIQGKNDIIFFILFKCGEFKVLMKNTTTVNMIYYIFD